MHPPPQRRTLVAIPVIVAVFESQLRHIRLGEPHLQTKSTPDPPPAARPAAHTPAHPSAHNPRCPNSTCENPRHEPGQTRHHRAPTDADIIIVFVKNGTPVHRQRRLLRHLALVMQILDAAKNSRAELPPLAGLVRISLRQQRARGQLDPIAVSVCPLEYLVRRQRVTRPHLRPGYHNRSTDDPPAQTGIPPLRPGRTKFFGFAKFLFHHTPRLKSQRRAHPRTVDRLVAAGTPARSLAQPRSVVHPADQNRPVLHLLEMAFQTQVRVAFGEQFVIDAPVRRMAGDAALRNASCSKTNGPCCEGWQRTELSFSGSGRVPPRPWPRPHAADGTQCSSSALPAPDNVGKLNWPRTSM